MQFVRFADNIAAPLQADINALFNVLLKEAKQCTLQLLDYHIIKPNGAVCRVFNFLKADCMHSPSVSLLLLSNPCGRGAAHCSVSSRCVLIIR
jgi:hypothetical protein